MHLCSTQVNIYGLSRGVCLLGALIFLCLIYLSETFDNHCILKLRVNSKKKMYLQNNALRIEDGRRLRFAYIYFGVRGSLTGLFLAFLGSNTRSCVSFDII